MKIQTRQNGHGWRTIIEDPDSQERWSGNIAETAALAREQAIDGFIEDKKNQVKVLDDKMWIIEKSIKKLIKLKK